MTDLDWLRAVAEQEGGFEGVIRPHLADLLAYFARRIRPREDAADCLSETMLVLWRRRDELPAEEDGVRAWAFGIAKRVLANQRRGQTRRSDLADQLRAELVVSVQPTPPMAGEVADALAQLKDVDRELVTLVAWDGFGVAEAGALLGLKPEASRARYSRARTKLRGLLF